MSDITEKRSFLTRHSYGLIHALLLRCGFSISRAVCSISTSHLPSIHPRVFKILSKRTPTRFTYSNSGNFSFTAPLTILFQVVYLCISYAFSRIVGNLCVFGVKHSHSQNFHKAATEAAANAKQMSVQSFIYFVCSVDFWISLTVWAQVYLVPDTIHFILRFWSVREPELRDRREEKDVYVFSMRRKINS